jgi:hypothetical protein
MATGSTRINLRCSAYPCLYGLYPGESRDKRQNNVSNVLNKKEVWIYFLVFEKR